MMRTEKHVFVKKMFTNRLNLGSPTWARVGKTIHGVETHWVFGKKKFRAQQSGKKIILTSFCTMKRPIAIDFFEKGATVNNSSNCLILGSNIRPRTHFISISLSLLHIDLLLNLNQVGLFGLLGFMAYHIYQPLRSGRIWHKVNF